MPIIICTPFIGTFALPIESIYRDVVVADSPIAYWRLGESAGTVAEDVISTNDGTYTNTPTLGTTGSLYQDPNTAITLDGISQHVIVADSVILNPGLVSNGWTVETWAKNATGGSQLAILASKRIGSGDFQQYTLAITDNDSHATGAGNKISFTLRQSATIERSGYTNDDFLTDTEWHHLLGTYDPVEDRIRIYVDGVEAPVTMDYNVGGVPNISTTEPLGLGRSSGGTLYWAGSLDEPAIYDKVLSLTEARSHYQIGSGDSDFNLAVADSGAVAYWRMDDPSGTTITDYISKSTGATTGTPTFGGTSLVQGNGNSINFTVHPDYFDISGQLGPKLHGSSAISAEAWFKMDSLPVGTEGVILMHSHDAGDVAMRLSISSTGFLWGGGESTAADSTIVATYPFTDTTKIHHVVAVNDYNNDVLNMYLDGVLVAQIVSPGWGSSTYVYGTPAFGDGIGGWSLGTGFDFSGDIEHVAVYDKVITLSDVRAHYLQSGNFSDYEYSVRIDNPNAYWRLGESSGTTAFDEIGSVNGNYVGNYTLARPGLLTNDADTSIQLTAGTASRINFGDVNLIDRTGGVTLEAWWKPFGDTGHIITKERTGVDYPEWQLIVKVTGELRFYTNTSNTPGTAHTLDTVKLYNDSSNTYHVVATWDGTTKSIYVNGVLEAQTAWSGTIYTNSSPVTIGNSEAGTDATSGNIDEVAIYDYALAPAQIQNHYEAGRGLAAYRTKILKNYPLRYWRFAEADGTVAYDETEVGDGTYVNAPTLGNNSLLATNINPSVTFDGISDAVTFPFSNGALSSITIEFWLNTSQTSAVDNKILLHKGTPTGFEDFVIYHAGSSETANKLGIYLVTDLGASAALLSTSDINDGKTHHIVFTWDSVSARIRGYIDSVLEITGTRTGNTLNNSSSTMRAMSYASSVKISAGIMDDLAIYDYVLNTADILEHYNEGNAYLAYENAVIANTPVSYWRLGEYYGTIAIDSVDVNHGTYLGTPTLDVNGALVNNLNTAVTFNGTTDAIDVGNPTNLQITGNNISIEAWVKFTTTQASKGIIAKWGTSTYSYFLGTTVGGTGMSFIIRGLSANNVTVNSSPINDGNWHHVVSTYDGIALRMYIDGVVEPGTTSHTDSIINTTDNVFIGAYGAATPTAFFDGSIDEAAIYNVALTPTQIANHYNIGHNSAADGPTYGEWAPAYSAFEPNDIITVNFGESAFVYSIPSGYSAAGADMTWSNAVIYKDPDITLSNGNLTAQGDNVSHNAGLGSKSWGSGKWYWETTMNYTAAGATVAAGIMKVVDSLDTYLGATADGIGTFQNGNTARNGVTIASPGVFGNGGVISHKLDVDLGTYEVSINGGSYTFIANL